MTPLDRLDYLRSAALLCRTLGGIRFLALVVRSGGPAADVCREVLRDAAGSNESPGIRSAARSALARIDGVPEMIEK